MADITQNFSQLLLTYGPGAMLDLPDQAVVVAGLQDWRYGPDWSPLEEERLVSLLRRELGDKLDPSFQGLRSPPVYDEDRHDENAPGVSVRIFPTWFVADDPRAGTADGQPATDGDNEKRRQMTEFENLNINKSGKMTFPVEGKNVAVNPVRFVGACARGHLQDIDWRRIAHRKGDPACRKTLHWVERGVSSDPSDISVRCTCGAFATLGDLYKPGFLGGCGCFSPWLTPRRIAEEVCDNDLRLLPRSATNTYFAQTVTVISLTKSDDAARQAVEQNRTTIDSIRTLPNFLVVLRTIPNLKEAFKDFSDAEIMRALDERAGGGSTADNPRIAEFDLLASGARVVGSDAVGSYLFAETLPHDRLGLHAPWDRFLQNVVKVHRLREVTCLYGFTRLEPAPTAAESEMDEVKLAVDGAKLAREVTWLPAIEQFGEGIFLHVSSEFIRDWLNRPEVAEIAARLRHGEDVEASKFNRPPRHLGAAYWALHSLSHAFMAELALECGYPLSSLKERVYSSKRGEGDRYAILIYTSTAGGQGTLGGLSNIAERAGEILERAKARLTLCSNDPICSEQTPGNDDQPMQGAACHACLLVPETSCEARNTRVDRSLLVSTVVGRRHGLLG